MNFRSLSSPKFSNILLLFQYYNEDEASRYASNSHIVAIQSEMAERAIELLALPEDKPSFLLDIGKFRIFL